MTYIITPATSTTPIAQFDNEPDAVSYCLRECRSKQQGLRLRSQSGGTLKSFAPNGPDGVSVKFYV